MGHVGQALGEKLIKAGARLTITDINATTINTFLKKYSAKTCTPEQFYAIPCDILSPCALGACLNTQTINQLNTKIIAGAANNQLANTEAERDTGSTPNQ